MNELSEFLESQITAINRVALQGLKSGQEIGRIEAEPMRRALDLILREYDACKGLENVNIPTRLELAIEAARRFAA